ncbi:hypothetical protein FRB94_012825 [Tulasnella sp. JGI-2019a]|nr:hypothetical protein FRB94_012825 [Tulasnella sp. JGI-2019a]
MPHASWPTLTSYHRTRSNTPVYRLPDDILLDILLLDLGLTFTFEWYERLGQLMLVCSRWQALSIAPSPWAHVSAAQTLSIVKNSLCKSRDALLDVVYVSFALNYRSLRLDINEICDLLTNIHRWRYFEFWQWDISGFTEAAGAFINRLRHLIAPNLNSISLKSPILASIEEPFTPEITQLRHISVHNCIVPWDSNLFTGPKTLRLSIPGNTGPSLDQFINLLRASPEPVTLSLQGLDLHGPLLTHTQIITLPSLETFEIQYTACHVIGDLFAILHLPNALSSCSL